MLSNSKFQKFAEKLSVQAGKILSEYRKKTVVLQYKDIEDAVTTADLASEKYIVGEIAKRYPSHSIFSEERGEIKKQSGFRWIIDPLDGTKEYLRDIPLYNVSITLESDGHPIAAALYRPGEKVLYSAAKGRGAFKNGARIKVSGKKKLEQAFVYCYLPSFKRNREKYNWAFKKLAEIGKRVYRLRALADENTALCWLAQGGIEAYINLSNKPKVHDIVTGLFIAQEAGAVIDTQKAPVLACNNRVIYHQLVALI